MSVILGTSHSGAEQVWARKTIGSDWEGRGSDLALSLRLVLLLLFFACARQGFPPGGPVDRQPPRVLRTWPEPGATQVPLDAEIVVEFSEKVLRGSVEDAVFLSPAPEGPLRLRWKGRRLHIRVPGGLRPERTYVLTLGAGIRDLRNNPMHSSYALAFSTGQQIHRGGVEGVVLRQWNPAPGVLAAAYDLAEVSQPDPRKNRAMYFTQTGEGGLFRLDYLKCSVYRVFVWEDRNANRLWDCGEEAIGIGSREVVVTPDSVLPRLLFQLVPLDTLAPRLLDARSPDRRHVVIRSSERIDSVRSRLKFGLRPAVPILFYRDDLFGDRLQVASFADLPRELRLRVEGLADRWGNTTASDSLALTVSAMPDTSRPRLAKAAPQDSARRVRPDTPIDLWFSEAIDTAAADGAVELVGLQQGSVPCVRMWLTPAHLRLTPLAPLPGSAEYVIRLQGPQLRDVSGNAFSDTLVTLRFWTLNPDTLTEICGSVLDAKPGAEGPVHILALRPGEANPAAEIILPGEGPYCLTGLLPGRYVLLAFRDEDGDGTWSPGWPWPFRPAERCAVYADTVRARARWINEGNDFRLP